MWNLSGKLVLVEKPISKLLFNRKATFELLFSYFVVARGAIPRGKATLGPTQNFFFPEVLPKSFLLSYLLPPHSLRH